MKNQNKSEEYRQRYIDWKDEGPQDCPYCGGGPIKLVNWFSEKPEFRCSACKKIFKWLVL